MKEADVALFLQVTRIRKVRKNASKLNSSIIARNRTITKQRTLQRETNETDRNPLITNHKPWFFELVPINICFLRGSLRWLTEQKNPKFLRSLQNTQRDTTNFGFLGLDEVNWQLTNGQNFNRQLTNRLKFNWQLTFALGFTDNWQRTWLSIIFYKTCFQGLGIASHFSSDNVIKCAFLWVILAARRSSVIFC